MTPITAIDPGPTQSAIVTLCGDGIAASKMANADVLRMMREFHEIGGLLAIEQIRSYGMSVGAEVFDTVHWSGRFCEASGIPDDVIMVPRLQVKIAMCRSAKANDANIRQAIIDRYGGKEVAIGKKKTPGPLFGISGDMWSALAVALTVMDMRKEP